jgi:hypothetical protein
MIARPRLLDLQISDRIGIDHFHEKKVACVVRQRVIFQNFLVGGDIGFGDFDKIVQKHDIVPYVRMVDKAGIVRQVEIAAAPPVGGVKQMAQTAAVDLMTHGDKGLLFEDFIDVVIELPDEGSRRDILGGKQTYAVDL